jgi:hypothetical protein
MKKPRLTELVMSGLTEALTRMEADDLTDLEPDRDKAFRAANNWLVDMHRYRSTRKVTKSHAAIAKAVPE